MKIPDSRASLQSSALQERAASGNADGEDSGWEWRATRTQNFDSNCVYPCTLSVIPFMRSACQ